MVLVSQFTVRSCYIYVLYYCAIFMYYYYITVAILLCAVAILRRTLACTPKAYCSHYSIVRMILSYINPVEKTLSQKVCSISAKYKFYQMITYYSRSFTVTENVLINHDELTRKKAFSLGPVQAKSSPVQSSPVQSSPVQSSPVQSSPVQSSPAITICRFNMPVTYH